MAVSVEDKIELFRDIIYKDIEESSFEKRQKTAEDYEREKARLLKEVEAKRDRIVAEAEKKAEKDRQRLIEKEKSKEYHQLLDKRQQFINEVVELLMQEARRYTEGAEYKDYLSRNIAKAIAAFSNADSVELYFTAKDLNELEGFLADSMNSFGTSCRCVLKEAGQNIIGGFYAVDGRHEIQADYTLRSLVEENRELIGTSISRRLDEVQGNE